MEKATVLLLLFFCHSCYSQDPCSSYKVLENIENRNPEKPGRPLLIDDYRLTPGWYAAPGKWELLSRDPGGSSRCGTLIPVYREQKLGNKSTMCNRARVSKCYRSFEIETRMCGNKEIYYLKTSHRRSGFCFFNNDPCANYPCANGGTSSLSTFINNDPCANNPCANGGRCLHRSRAPLGYRCRCTTEFRGQNCTKTVQHLVSGCPSLAQTSYLKRQDDIPRCFHYRLRHACGFDSEVHPWYDTEHVQGVLENDNFKLQWNKPTHSLRRIPAHKPDLVSLFCNRDRQDILIMEDVSLSIGETSFDRAKQFQESLISSMSINVYANYVAYLVFSSTARVVFNFTEYSNSKPGILSALKNMAYESGSITNFGEAINVAVNSVFKVSAGDRQGVHNAVIMFTDGFATEKEREVIDASIQRLHAAAEVFVVALSDVEANSTVYSLASKPDNIFRISSNDAVSSFQSKLKSCPK